MNVFVKDTLIRYTSVGNWRAFVVGENM